MSELPYLIRPRPALAIAAAISVVAALCIPKLRIEPDLSKLLPADNPVTQLGRAIQQRTSSDRDMLIELRGEDLAALSLIHI